MKPSRARAAWIVAILVDALQVGLLPVTGTLSTWFGAPLDVLAMVVLWRLVGWHWALAPSFVFEFLPFVELAPTWTLATWIVLRKRRSEETARPGDSPSSLPFFGVGGKRPPLDH
ncbi:MAG TPA: hypothetical protein PKM35_07085 [Holophaga sp.]|nr:hypothetical protein [Holophaga sp.]